MAVRKNAFLAAGGFDLSIQVAEDRDLAKRIKKIGKVYHLPHFVVYTSGRRFQKLGIVCGLWSYLSIFFHMKLNRNQKSITFQSGSEIVHLNMFLKVGINVFVLLTLVTGVFGVKQVKAEIKEKEVHLPKKFISKEQEIRTNFSHIELFQKKHTTYKLPQETLN